jgi:hypothetical protein
MRNMSFALTTDQVRARTKTVTRRLGWRFARPGMVVRAVRKCMGLRPGEKVEPLAVIRFVSVRREHLGDIDVYPADETAKEGFPGMPSGLFLRMFTDHMRCNSDDEVTRIEFEYVDDPEAE